MKILNLVNSHIMSCQLTAIPVGAGSPTIIAYNLQYNKPAPPILLEDTILLIDRP